MLARLRTNFLTGIVVIAPVALTIWLISSIIGWFDGLVLPFVPDAYRPEKILNTFFGYDLKLNIRGVGVVVFLVFAILVGWLAKGLIGRSFIKYAENLVNRMPVVRSFYSGIKQIAETVFAQKERSFEKACMIEYPRKGIWAIGFISTDAKGEIAERNSSKGSMVSVFVPTTPNPTSGFLLFFPKSDIVELDMSIEDAAKLVISAGLVYPPTKNTKSKSSGSKSKLTKKVD
jgi:uncharacterized membrane protein